MRGGTLTTPIDRPAPGRDRLAEWCGSLLFSSRPRWAMMPTHAATPFADALLFTVSLLDELRIPYVAHYGTLLGAVRLGGVAPWDEDADLYILEGDLASLALRLESALVHHGFESRMRVKGDALYVRRRPWLAGQGHIGISVLPVALPAGTTPDDPGWDAYMSLDELRPLQRLRFYSSHIEGPALPEPVLERLYGKDGSPEVMSRFVAPRVSAPCHRFWAEARPIDGPTDWPRISRHFTLKAETWSHMLAFPWWWFNGAYNIGIDRLRRFGRSRH